MVVRLGHIHSAVPFIILAVMLCTEHVLDATNIFELPNILKFPYFMSWKAIAGCTWGLGGFGGIRIVFLPEGGYQGDYRIRIGIRLFPMTCGGIVCVQVCEVNHGAGSIEILRFLDPVKHNRHESVLSKLLFIREHRINHGTHFLHGGEIRIYVVVATEEREIFEFLFVHPVINNQLRPEDIQTQPQLYQSTVHLAPADLIFVCEEVFLRVLRCVAASYEVVFNY